MKIQLTDNEWEIAEHRLSLSDAIAEMLTDGLDSDMPEDERELIFEEIEGEVETLRKTVELTKTIDTDTLTRYQREALVDCMEGSTFFADMDDAVFEGEFTKGKALALRKAGHSLQRKLNEAGIEGSMCWD
jgi:lipase chaperone LimK